MFGWILPRRGTVTRVPRLKGGRHTSTCSYGQAANTVAGGLSSAPGVPLTRPSLQCYAQLRSQPASRGSQCPPGEPLLWSCWHLGSRVAPPATPESHCLSLSFPPQPLQCCCKSALPCINLSLLKMPRVASVFLIQPWMLQTGLLAYPACAHEPMGRLTGAYSYE